MIQQQDRPKELLYVVTPALTASLPCNTMTYNDILYVSLCMYHYVSIYIYICTIMIHYVPMILYASKRPEMSKPGIPAKLRAKWPGDSWRLNVPEIKKRLIQTLSFFCILQYFSLYILHCCIVTVILYIVRALHMGVYNHLTPYAPVSAVRLHW